VATVQRAFPRGGAHVVVIGSGAMARDVARGLDEIAVGRITIAGRHAPSVELVARGAQAKSVPLATFLEGHVPCDAVVSAVSVREPLLTPATLRAIGARLVVDLGAVPNVAPEVPLRAAPVIVRLDDLATGDRTHTFAVAERLVEREVTRYATVLRAQASRGAAARKAS
jgi:glutamyl-tRNA reductase